MMHRWDNFLYSCCVNANSVNTFKTKTNISDWQVTLSQIRDKVSVSTCNFGIFLWRETFIKTSLGVFLRIVTMTKQSCYIIHNACCCWPPSVSRCNGLCVHTVSVRVAAAPAVTVQSDP